MDWIYIYIYTVVAVTLWIPNTLGSKSEPINVGLAVKQGQGQTEYIVGQKNTDLHLNCSVTSDPALGPLTFNWTKNGEPVDLSSSKRIQVLENGSLYIRRVLHRPKKDVSDEGRYRCYVQLGKLGRVVAADVLVKIAGIERKFDIEPQPISVVEGGVARFQCKIQATPPAMYIWQLNKTALPQDVDRYLMLNSGILQITGVRSEDTGMYSCYATPGVLHKLPGQVFDIEGKNSPEAQLDVIKGAAPKQVKIIAYSQNVTTVRDFEPAVLECLVQGLSDLSAVEWWKIPPNGNGVQVVGDNGRIEKFGSNLRFLETMVTDTGTYRCKAGTSTADMRLSVIQKPVITDISESVKNPKASWNYMDCEAKGYPKPTITWLKDGQPVVYGKPGNYDLTGKNKLAITQSELYNSGFYQCVATNAAGTVSAFLRLEIFMQENVPNPPMNLTAEDVTSRSIKVVWKASLRGEPPIAYSVHIVKHGTDQGEDKVSVQLMSQLENLDPYSNYTIYVTAYSKQGAGVRSDVLVVTTKEDVPTRAPIITLEPGPSSIKVIWAEMLKQERHGVIKTYKIYYRKRGSDLSTNVEENVPGTAKDFTIQDLEADTEYEVRVLAATSAGFPNLSNDRWPWVAITTESEQYIAAPGIHIKALNLSAIQTSWTYDSNMPIGKFQIELKHLTSAKLLRTEEVEPDVRDIVFIGLDSEDMYEVVVSVHLTDGRQAEAVQEISLSEMPLPPVPRNVHVTLRHADALNVQWQVLGSSLEVTYFSVKIAQLSDGNVKGKETIVTSNVNSALLDNLLPYSQYEISVRSHVQDLQGRYSNPIIERTLQGVPSEPQDIQVKVIGPQRVSVAWTPPAEPKGQIKSYTIYYSDNPESTDQDSWEHVTMNATEPNNAVINIADAADRKYYFKVVASTDQGPGLMTQFVQAEVGKSTKDDGMDKQLGIMIGIAIGVLCIIICIIIICACHRCRGMGHPGNRQQPQTIPARFHGNGHIPGNGNGHAHKVQEGSEDTAGFEMDTYTPMLKHLPENELSDSKGGGSGNVILTPNGAKMNGFIPLKKNGIKNNGLHNGHLNYISTHYKEDSEEKRQLLMAAMLGGGTGTETEGCISVGDDNFSNSRYEHLGSLDNIDKGTSESSSGSMDSRGSADSRNGGSTQNSDRHGNRDNRRHHSQIQMQSRHQPHSQDVCYTGNARNRGHVGHIGRSGSRDGHGQSTIGHNVGQHGQISELNSRQGDQYIEGQMVGKAGSYGSDSGEGSLSHSSSERNSTGYILGSNGLEYGVNESGYVGSGEGVVPVRPGSATTDTDATDDTVIYCGESGISGMGFEDGGEGEAELSGSSDGPLSPRDSWPDENDSVETELPQSQRVTSASCEDTYHDGGTVTASRDERLRSQVPPPPLPRVDYGGYNNTTPQSLHQESARPVGYGYGHTNIPPQQLSSPTRSPNHHHSSGGGTPLSYVGHHGHHGHPAATTTSSPPHRLPGAGYVATPSTSETNGRTASHSPTTPQLSSCNSSSNSVNQDLLRRSSSTSSSSHKNANSNAINVNDIDTLSAGSDILIPPPKCADSTSNTSQARRGGADDNGGQRLGNGQARNNDSDIRKLRCARNDSSDGRYSDRDGKISDRDGRYSDRDGRYSDRGGRYSDRDGRISGYNAGVDPIAYNNRNLNSAVLPGSPVSVLPVSALPVGGVSPSPPVSPLSSPTGHQLPPHTRRRHPASPSYTGTNNNGSLGVGVVVGGSGGGSTGNKYISNGVVPHQNSRNGSAKSGSGVKHVTPAVVQNRPVTLAQEGGSMAASPVSPSKANTSPYSYDGSGGSSAYPHGLNSHRNHNSVVTTPPPHGLINSPVSGSSSSRQVTSPTNGRQFITSPNGQVTSPVGRNGNNNSSRQVTSPNGQITSLGSRQISSPAMQEFTSPWQNMDNYSVTDSQDVALLRANNTPPVNASRKQRHSKV